MKLAFTSTIGQQYTIELDDDGEKITVLQSGKACGSISLCFRESEGIGMPDSYHITHLELEACKRQGLGRRCLQLHKEMFGLALTAGSNDGSRPDDGSYLIGDGPGFIEQMRKEGIVCRERDYDDASSDDY